MGDYTISDIYQGGYSTLKPISSNYITAGSLGMTTDPRTANILQEVSTKLSSGAKNIEVEAVSPEIFDSIPKQQLKEVHRLSKLTGIDVSMHAPVMNISGIDPRSGFSESEREIAERKVAEALIRARELNPEGNIPVNFHSAEVIPGSQFLPPSERKKLEEKEKLKTDYETMIVVNRESGQIAPIKKEIQYLPGMENIKTEKITSEEGLRMINKTQWDNKISQLIFNKERADEILEKNRPLIEHLIMDIQSGRFKEKDFDWNPEQKKAIKYYRDAATYLDDLNKQINSLFSKAYEFGTEEQRNELKKISERFGKIVSQDPYNPFIRSEALHNLLHDLRENTKIIPDLYVPIEKFAVEQSSKTLGNAAWKAYKEFGGKNVPIMVIENPPAGFALSTGEDIVNIVEASRQKFIENAVANGMSESTARREAEKLIGATWDVGHINMLRRFGYSEEEIIKETEKVAPYVKHVHLSDNFGFEHTELPMGMGNVPLKEIMEKLGQKGFEAKKIIEAGNWWQHFRTPPFQESLEGMGSPLYSMKMAPYWSQAPGLYQGYFSGMGQMLPQINYETFSAGFARLPTELGGSMQTGGSRMSGRGME